MRNLVRGHRAGGLILAHHARSWRRLRGLVLISACVLVVLELHALMHVAFAGEVLAAIRQAMRILCILLCGGILYRFISVAHAVANLRERVMRLQHRLARIEDAVTAPLASTQATLGDGETPSSATPFKIEAVVEELEPAAAASYHAGSATSDPAEGRLDRADSDTPAQSRPFVAPSHVGPTDPGDEEPLTERSLRDRLREALLSRNLFEALHVGRRLMQAHPDADAAREFAALAPLLEARLQTSETLPQEPAADPVLR
ncbi:MAG: hypothetical protein KJ057_03490 [Phycisphaerae bacterium]|nr:MAG: hypothetical protein EDS66_16840 [Planctomycetota bacterium]KAB2944959.1 MAG: hypothetical protein F9K17_10685 [Phycisphaerae bacterium]MBE7457715.1 hypothetical protein [Planctomycetia bacterium]MCK6463766.1 hypothetical protein [Phycisphaerae bacterium]MCL4717517.1 hypothetical protein [Phycisphaerae bacterium]